MRWIGLSKSCCLWTGWIQEHGWCWDIESMWPWFSRVLYSEMVIDEEFMSDLQDASHGWRFWGKMTYLCSPVILMNIFFMYICVSEMFLEREEMNITANLLKGYYWKQMLPYCVLCAGISFICIQTQCRFQINLGLVWFPIWD